MSDTVRVGLAVLILKDGKVLLGHRSAHRKDTGGRFEPDTWTVPGGKQEFGETMYEGAVREVREETGLKISDPETCASNNGGAVPQKYPMMRTWTFGVNLGF